MPQCSSDADASRACLAKPCSIAVHCKVQEVEAEFEPDAEPEDIGKELEWLAMELETSESISRAASTVIPLAVLIVVYSS
jgi:hypothetical protein